MDDELALRYDIGESDQVYLAESILSERHGISLVDAARLLIALADVGDVSPVRVATQIVDATIRPDAYPVP
jgi:hypothetical protein